jgi:serine-type D-Ala-D-Ala carboxypeptidase (penicillin-binding protein 5/6)
MKQISRFQRILGLTLLLGIINVQAATTKPATTTKPAATKTTATNKTTTAKAPAKPAPAEPKPGFISRDPYIGAIAIDAATGKVLFEDQADAKGYPASTLKLMDLLIILEKIEAKQLALTDQVTISAKASKTGGSQVWLAEKEVFSIDELLYALMIQSANDAAVALSEKIAGTSEAFVQLMNQRAKALGMNNTLFHSVHGLPPSTDQEPDVTTPRDFALLCREVLKHADALRYVSTKERPFRPNAGDKTVQMRNHNHLLFNVEGCDGLKTGYYAKAGYSSAITGTKNGKRVIVIILGSTTLNARDAKAKELLAKGLAALQTPAPAPTPAPPKK